jgi:hypothetical protein
MAMHPVDKELIRFEAMIINRAMDGTRSLTMTGLTEVVRRLSVADAQYLCGAFEVAELTIGDAVIALSAKIMMRYEASLGATTERPRMFSGEVV